jgi:hypothetical protein
MSSAWLTDFLRGANSYLSGAFVAVLLAPVLPDVLVDTLGHWAPAWLLRIFAILTVFVLCIAVYAWKRRLERKWAAKYQDPGFHRVKRCDVLVVGLSQDAKYRSADKGRNDPAIPEYLVQHTRPSTVVLVSTPEVQRLNEIQRNMSADGITVYIVPLSDAYDPKKMVPEISRGVLQIIDTKKLTGKQINVDVTSGTKIMSLAMFHLAQILNGNAVYVWREQENGEPKPGTQQSISFNPQDVLPTLR